MAKQFDGISILVPRNWHWMGKNDSDSLNTNAEALSDTLGLDIRQGNNVILLAGNAHDDANISRATIRLSVRMGTKITQSELQEAASEPRQFNKEIFEAAEQTAVAMRKLPQNKYYNATAGRLRQNGKISCVWVEFEFDLGKGGTIADTWICPVSGRTFKLSTSFAKARAGLYAATIDYVWRSLSLVPRH